MERPAFFEILGIISSKLFSESCEPGISHQFQGFCITKACVEDLQDVGPSRNVNLEMSTIVDQGQHEEPDVVKEEQPPVVGSSQPEGADSATTSGENPATCMGDVQ